MLLSCPSLDYSRDLRGSVTVENWIRAIKIVQNFLGERQTPDILEGKVDRLANVLEHQTKQLEEDNLCDALTQEWQTSKA